MTGHKRFLFPLIVCLVLFQTNGWAGGGFKKGPFYSTLVSVDAKNKTVVLGNKLYKVRQGVRIHDDEVQFPHLSTLITNQKVKYKLRKNRKTGQIEVSEIWVINR